MKYLQFSWMDGNTACVEHCKSWARDTYSQWLCEACGSPDTSKIADLHYLTNRCPSGELLFDVASTGVPFSLLHRKIVHYFGNEFCEAFMAGRVLSCDDDCADHLVCFGLLTHRVRYYGEESSELIRVCSSCGRQFANAIGKKFLLDSECQGRAFLSSVSGAAILVREDVFREHLPKDLRAQLVVVGYEVKEVAPTS